MVRNRGMVLTTLLAAAFALVAGVIGAPSTAQAVFVPTIHDDLAYVRSYAAGTASYPQAIAVTPFGDVYYTHSDYHMWDELTYDNRVFGVTSDGIEFLNIGASDYSQFQWPDGLALTNTGKLVVADTSDDAVLAHNRIRLFDSSNGTFIRNIGGYGSGPLGFDKPYGVTVADDGTIYVADTGNNRIQMVSEAGSYIGSWPMPVAAGVNPNGLDFDPDGHLWVAMEGSNKVCEFTTDGTLLRTISTWDETDSQGNYISTESLYGPMDVAVDSYGVVYICDTNNARIVRFDPNGEWLGTFHGYDTPEAAFSYPTDVDIDAFGNVYVADALNDTVYKFQFLMADPDTVPPVTTSNINEDWQQGPVQVSLSAYDASLTVSATLFSTDGSEPDTPYLNPFTISAEGTTTIKYFSVDRAENYEPVQSKMVRIDNTPPVTIPHYAAESWGLTTQVMLEATDALSEVHNTLYIVDNGSPYYYSGVPFTVYGIGNHTIDFYSFDHAGNSEEYKTIHLTVNAPDTQAPATQTNIPSGWINTSHSIEVTATDAGSGVAHTYFSTNGATPTEEYTVPVNVSSEGVTTVKYYSTDRAGNVEPVQTSQLKIDKTLPTSTCDGVDTYVNSATINFSAADVPSGVLDFVYRLDSGDWTHSYTLTTSAWGSHKVVWYAIDKAGNQQPTQTLNFTILQPDNEPPITGDDIPSSWIKGPVSVSIDAYDVVSEVQGIYYTINAGPTQTYTGPLSLNTEGVNTISYWAADTRGNVSLTTTKDLRIDNTPPVSSTNAQASYLGTAEITLSASDSLSSVGTMYWRLDGGTWNSAMPGYKVTCSTVGAHTLEYYAVDTPSNTEAPKSVNFSVTPPDSDPPVTTMNAPASWVRGPASVTFTATDALSTISGTYYSLAGANPPLSLYSLPLSVSAEGTTTITYRSVDFWGNYEAVKTGVVRVDNTAPVTGSDASANYVDQAQITLAPADPLSGPKNTYYRIDSGAWQQGTSVYVTGYSYHTIQFYSTDNAGNTEGVKSVNFRINRADRYYDEDDSLLLYRGTWYDLYGYGTTNGTADTSSDLVVYFQGDRFWYLAYTAPDAGIAQVSIDDGPWTNVDLYNNNQNSGNYVWYSGDLTYDYHMVRIRPSGLKNSSSSSTQINVDQIRVQGFVDDVPDAAPPVSSSNINENWQKGPVSVTLSAVDTTTGVAATYYSTDGGAPNTVYSAPFCINTDGQNIVKYYSVDKHGNVEATKSQYVRVDNTAPVTTSEAITGFTAAGTVALTAADTNGSGVANTKWRLDGGAWNTGASATIPYAVGNHLLEWYSTDAVGNVETVKSANVPVYARSEQTDAKMRYSNTWMIGSSTSYSGGSYYYAGSGYVDIAFTGTDFRWITTKGQIFGIARVTLDNNAPVLIDLYRGSTLHKQVVWTASGLAGTGVHRVRIEWTGQKNAAASNTYVGIDAVDIIGTLEPVDLEPPVTSAVVPSGWTKSPALVVLNPADAVSGVAQTYYRLDGGAQTAYTEPLSLVENGEHTVQYWSVDNRGNTEVAKSAQVRIDDGLPTSSSDIVGGWQHGTVNVTLSGSDALSGIEKIRYRLDGGALKVYSAPIAVSSDGVHELRFYATDNAGNVEAEHVQTVSIDDAAPAVSSDISEAWQQGPVSVTIDATDTVSAVASTYVRVDGAEPVPYTGSFSVSGDGTHTVEYGAVDNAGNASTPVSKMVRIDNSAPTIESDIDSAWQHGPVTVTLTAADSVSGIRETRYAIDGGASQVYSAPFAVSEGVHDISYWTEDFAGNATEPAMRTLRIDDTAPATASDAVAEYINPAVINLTPTDAGSTVVCTKYKLDNAEWAEGIQISCDTPGFHSVSFASVDAIGNAETTQTVDFQVLDRHEQLDASIRRTGTWYTGIHQNHSGGSYGYSNTANARVDMAFVGTQVDVIAMTGQIFGIARVTIDDQAPVDVDLYNSYSKYRQKVFTISDLPYGLHTLRIERTGLKNPNASNTFLNFDALDVDGALEAVDLEAPVTSSNAPAAWVKGDVSLSLSAEDAVAGVAATFLRIADGELAEYTSPMTISAEGTTTVEFFSVDVRGNRETTRSADIRIDNTAPITTSDATAPWQRGPVSVQLSGTDALSGVTHTYYRIDGGDEQLYSDEVSIDGDGVHTLEFYSVDAAGNVEAPKSTTVRVDNTAPSTSSTADGNWHKDSVSVSFSATDELSDIAGISYRIDGGTVAAYDNAPVSISGDGTHTVSFWATDNAGNVEAANIVAVYVDSTAPVTTTAASDGWQRGPVEVSLQRTDSHAGVDTTYYSIDGGTQQTYTAPFSVSGTGTHTIAYHSVDAVGNVETTRAATVKIDDLAPNTTTDAPSGPVYADTTVHFTGTDAHSGLDKVQVRVNGGAWNDVSQVSLTAVGRYVIDYRSYDKVGNVEATKTKTVYYLKRSEQDHAFVRRTGTWYVGTSGGYSGGTYGYSSSTGTRVDIAFMGTRVDLVDTMGGIFGIARVTVDNLPPVDVDLYASATKYKQTVFSMADLPYGLHTVKIERTGLKNAAATGTYLNLDAVDVDGDLVAVDLEAPVTTSNASASWVKGPVNLALTPVDAVSGVASTFLQIGTGDFVSYQQPVTISAEGITSANYYSIDQRGNREVTKSASVKIDNTAPATTSNATSSWQKGPVSVTLTATDALSGVATKYYSVDGGAAIAYSAPFSVDGDGLHTISFRSVDAAGNLETSSTATLSIDNTPPSSTDNAVNTYQASATINIASTDAGSGVASTKWRLDGGAWQTGLEASSTIAGVHVLEYYGTDNAGNAEPVKSRTFGIIQRTDQGTRDVYYQGTWYTGSNTGYHGGTYGYLASPGAAEFSFVGTRFDWIGTKGRIFGIAKVTIDGGAPEYVDLYAGSTLYKQTIKSVTGLTNTRHTVRIEWTGTKNALATNHYVNVDALDLLGNFSARQIEQNEKMLYYTGSWASGANASYSGGTYTYLASEGGLTVTFEGTRADWVATKSRVFGIAKVTVDGGAPTYVDLYSSATQYQQTVFSAANLPNTTHTMKIEWTGGKNVSATNNYINVDTVDLIGRLLGVRYEQTNGLFHFDTPWITSPSVSYSGGSYNYTANAGAANLTFDGSRIELIATKGTAFGIAKITLDGGAPTLVDLYSATTQYKQVIFTAENLSAGAHTVRLEWTGTKNAAAASNYVNLDAVDLVGKPVYARVEQGNARVYDQGGWVTGSSASFSGGSYAYTYSAGSKTLAFDGTYVSLIAMKAPIFGIMRVTLDGTPVDVDLYSATNQYRQTVFSASGLTNGRHIIKVEWTGTKNPLATDSYVNLDGYDLVGVTATYDPIPAPTRYEEDATGVVKGGTWISGVSAGYSGGGYVYSTSESSATIAFDGTELKWIGVKGSIFGIASVSVDGGAPTLVDLYSATSLSKTVLWTTGTLAPGRHTVVISFTGDKNAAASKNYINIDAVDIQGTIVP